MAIKMINDKVQVGLKKLHELLDILAPTMEKYMIREVAAKLQFNIENENKSHRPTS